MRFGMTLNEGVVMSDELESIGPVDYLVVEFPLGHVPGEALARLVDLVDHGVVHILDLIFIRKDPDGTVVGLELSDLDGDGEVDLRVLDGASSGLLGNDEVTEAASVIEAGSAGMVALYENSWAAPFASALRRADAQLVASGRIPVEELLTALDAAEASEPAGT
jgi:hypothetical protein